MLTKFIVVIISHYMHVSNHYVVLFKLIQCYSQLQLSKIGEGGVEKIQKLSHHTPQESVIQLKKD